jgi:HMG (high mobility group) box
VKRSVAWVFVCWRPFFPFDRWKNVQNFQRSFFFLSFVCSKMEKPKRPLSAYMLWLNHAREGIKKENPGIKVTEIAKKGGELWRGMKDKTVGGGIQVNHPATQNPNHFTNNPAC